RDAHPHRHAIEQESKLHARNDGCGLRDRRRKETMTRMLVGALLLLTGIASADSTYPSMSIYQLSAQLTSQAGADHGLDLYKGHPVLVTMFYGSCGHTCPLLIETLRAVERAAPDGKSLRVLMIS